MLLPKKPCREVNSCHVTWTSVLEELTTTRRPYAGLQRDELNGKYTLATPHVFLINCSFLYYSSYLCRTNPIVQQQNGLRANSATLQNLRGHQFSEGSSLPRGKRELFLPLIAQHCLAWLQALKLYAKWNGSFFSPVRLDNNLAVTLRT